MCEKVLLMLPLLELQLQSELKQSTYRPVALLVMEQQQQG
jgi:hypothetical protein